MKKNTKTVNHAPDPLALHAVEWVVAPEPVPYLQAEAEMQAHVEAIILGKARERVWLLQHPPLYTAGTSAQKDDLIDPDRFPVFSSGRGGQYTYHGPGQRVAYVMLDLRKRGRDVRAFVQALERWIILTLDELGVAGEVRDERIGVWVKRGQAGREREDKIAAIGIRLRRWVSFHGISLNVCPDLSHFDGIVPCGITEHGVTSLKDLGLAHDMQAVDSALKVAFAQVFDISPDVE
jgi:lipoyl(octanoyl) transferase